MIPPQWGMLTIGALPMHAAALDDGFDLRLGVELLAEVEAGEHRDRLVGRERVRDAAEPVRAVAVDAAVLDVEHRAGHREALAGRDIRRCGGRNLGQPGVDVGDEIAHLLIRDHRAPDRHVRLGRVLRLAEAVVDDVSEGSWRSAMSRPARGRARPVRSRPCPAGRGTGQHANWTNTCAPAATCGSNVAGAAARSLGSRSHASSFDRSSTRRRRRRWRVRPRGAPPGRLPRRLPCSAMTCDEPRCVDVIPGRATSHQGFYGLLDARSPAGARPMSAALFDEVIRTNPGITGKRASGHAAVGERERGRRVACLRREKRCAEVERDPGRAEDLVDGVGGFEQAAFDTVESFPRSGRTVRPGGAGSRSRMARWRPAGSAGHGRPGQRVRQCRSGSRTGRSLRSGR